MFLSRKASHIHPCVPKGLGFWFFGSSFLFVPKLIMDVFFEKNFRLMSLQLADLLLGLYYCVYSESLLSTSRPSKSFEEKVNKKSELRSYIEHSFGKLAAQISYSHQKFFNQSRIGQWVHVLA